MQKDKTHKSWINIQLFAESKDDKAEVEPPSDVVTSPKITESESKITDKDQVITDNASGGSPPSDNSTTSINAEQDTSSDTTPLTQEALVEIEQALKDTPPDEVQLFQRELSKALKVDLFSDKGAVELFQRYSPERRARLAKVNEVVEKVAESEKRVTNKDKVITDNASSGTPSTTTINADDDTATELLRNGCPNDWLNDAVILAQSQVKSKDDLSAVKAIASRYASITANNTQAILPIRTSASIGEKAKELTDGERAVQHLRQKNPDGFKK